MAIYYSALKFLRFTDRLSGEGTVSTKAPVHIRIKPTNRCNHNCWYCAYRTDELSLGEEMVEEDSIPAARMLALAKEFVEIGIEAVTFSGGGEPLLYKCLPEVIEILAAGGVKVGALTNGSNLKGRMADAFASHGTWIRVSLDAWDNISYVKSRGAQPEGFSRLIDNIQAFAARNSNCTLGVSLIVEQENYKHIFELCTLLKSCGVNHIKVSGAVVSNDIEGNNAYHFAIKAEVERQIGMAQTLVDSNFDVLNHYHDIQERFTKNYHTCPSLRFLTVIGADQSVYTCQDKAYTSAGCMGSLRNMSFKDLWFSESNQRFLRSFDPATSCNHHCVSHVKNIVMHEYLAIDKSHSCFV